MSKSRIIAAIDIGSSKIATLIAQLGRSDLEGQSVNIVGVSQVNSRGVRKGQIVDIEEAVEATIQSVEAAERMAGYNLDSAFIAIGGAHVSSQNSKGVVAVSNPEGEIQPEDIERVIEAARAVSLPSSREIVHVLPREYIVDGESGVQDPIGMSGVRLEVETHLVTASSSAIRNLTKCIQEVGVDIASIVYSGLASCEAVMSNTEKELGAVCIDIGGGTTSIAAYVDGALAYSGVIPVGARNVTNDLAIGLRVNLEAAEKIKLALSGESTKKDQESDQIELSELGVSENKKVSKKTLVEGIIRPRLNEIFSMVRLELDRAGLTNRIPSGAILTGGGALTVGVLESAKRTLALPVRIGTPQGITGLVDDILTPTFSATIGLLLYGAKVNIPQTSMGGSIGSKIRLPTRGVAGKLIDAVKRLLP